MKVAICEDELETIKDISEKILYYVKDKNLDLKVFSYDSGEGLLKDIIKKEVAFDIIFLDIKMKDLNGIETARVIRETNIHVIIVFISALQEYVFHAFDVEAMDFIVKPIKSSKLHRVLDKAVKKVNQQKNEVLVVHKNNNIKKLPFKDLLYCEVSNHTVFVYEDKVINEYIGKIDALSKELNGDFFRCHRSYIVNLAKVESYKNGFAYLPSGEKIPVATRRQSEFMKAMLNHKRNEVR